MEYVNKLIPIRRDNSIFYAYPRPIMTPEIVQYIKLFTMEREIFSKNRQKYPKKETINACEKLARDPEIWLIPRFLAQSIAEKFGIPIANFQFDRHLIEKPESAFKLSPRPGQMEICDCIFDIFYRSGGLTLKLDTGHGKSWIVSRVVWQIWQHTIIFVANKDLQQQMYDEIQTCTEITWACKIGGSARAADRRALADFVTDKWNPNRPFIGIAVYFSGNNLYQEVGSDVWNRFYLSVYDECHVYCNDTGIPLLKYCQTPVKLALSATPEQSWNNKLVQLWCGMILDGNQFMTKRNIEGEVKIIRYYGQSGYCESQKDDRGINNFIATLRIIESDENRIALGIKEIYELYSEGLCPMVFFHHCDYLARVADEFQAKYGVAVGRLIGETPEVDRPGIKQTSEVIFTTYKFGKIGLNVPRVKSVVFMQPHKTQGTQVNGRALRDLSEVTRKYVDIVDMASFLGKQLSTRLIDYKARGFKINYVVNKVSG